MPTKKELEALCAEQKQAIAALELKISHMESYQAGHDDQLRRLDERWRRKMADASQGTEELQGELQGEVKALKWAIGEMLSSW